MTRWKQFGTEDVTAIAKVIAEIHQNLLFSIFAYQNAKIILYIYSISPGYLVWRINETLEGQIIAISSYSLSYRLKSKLTAKEYLAIAMKLLDDAYQDYIEQRVLDNRVKKYLVK